MYPMVLIGISGKMGAGKDYMSSLIINLFRSYGAPVIQLAFADQLKINVAVKNQIPIEQLIQGNKTKEMRQLLQNEGSAKMDWCDCIKNWIEIHRARGIQHFIISDVRMKKEADFIKSIGGKLIRIEAPERNMARLKIESGDDPKIMKMLASHISEVDLDDYDGDFDMIVTNDHGIDNSINFMLPIISTWL